MANATSKGCLTFQAKMNKYERHANALFIDQEICMKQVNNNSGEQYIPHIDEYYLLNLHVRLFLYQITPASGSMLFE